MSNSTREIVAPYAVFFWAALGMLIGGGAFQAYLPLQWGLLATEFIVVLGITLALRAFLHQTDLDVRWPTFREWDMPPAAVVLLFVAAPLLGILANLVAAAMAELSPWLGQLAEQYEQMTDTLFPADDPLLWAAGALSVTIAAPLCEEFLFRGTILPLQQRAHRSAVLIVVTNGLMFGAIHFNPLSFVALSIVGAFLADIALRSRTIWPAILGHAILNGCNGLLLPLIGQHYGDVEEKASLGEIGVALAVVAPLAILAWWGMRRLMPAIDLES